MKTFSLYFPSFYSKYSSYAFLQHQVWQKRHRFDWNLVRTLTQAEMSAVSTKVMLGFTPPIARTLRTHSAQNFTSKPTCV